MAYSTYRTRQRRRRRNRRTPNQLKRELGEALYQHLPGQDNLEIMTVEDDHFTYRKCRECPGIQVPYSINRHGTLMIDFTEETPLQDNLQVNTQGRKDKMSGSLLPIEVQRQHNDDEDEKEKIRKDWESSGSLPNTEILRNIQTPADRQKKTDDDRKSGGSLLPIINS